jgi:hypothetical protein
MSVSMRGGGVVIATMRQPVEVGHSAQKKEVPDQATGAAVVFIASIKLKETFKELH